MAGIKYANTHTQRGKFSGSGSAVPLRHFPQLLQRAKHTHTCLYRGGLSLVCLAPARFGLAWQNPFSHSFSLNFLRFSNHLLCPTTPLSLRSPFLIAGAVLSVLSLPSGWFISFSSDVCGAHLLCHPPTQPTTPCTTQSPQSSACLAVNFGAVSS